MNIFKPAKIGLIEVGLDGHYTVSGEYQGRKFVVDEINPLAIHDSVNAELDQIALIMSTPRFKAQPKKPFNCNPS